MFTLSIHPDAKRDLEEIRAADRSAAADLVVCLQELQNDQDRLDRLTQNGYSYEGGEWLENIDVQQIVSQQIRGNNLWRLKLWALERDGLRYRIIYAFLPRKRAYYILAVADRDHFNYEPDHPITRRVLAAYGEL